MTVVAYSARHGIVATDSRSTDEDSGSVATVRKLFALRSGATLGLCGDADTRDVVALFDRAKPASLPTRRQLAALRVDVGGILAFPGGRVWVIDAGFRELLCGSKTTGMWTGSVAVSAERCLALGTGGDLALGAMLHGASPVEAVRIACRRNAFCAPPVRWRKVG